MLRCGTRRVRDRGAPVAMSLHGWPLWSHILKIIGFGSATRGFRFVVSGACMFGAACVWMVMDHNRQTLLRASLDDWHPPERNAAWLTVVGCGLELMSSFWKN